MAVEQLHVPKRAPTEAIFRAAFVMKVRRPEWLEQPTKPRSEYHRKNMFTMAWAVVRGDRSVLMTWFDAGLCSARQIDSASRSARFIGMTRPARPLLARSSSRMSDPMFPEASESMLYVRFAITCARRPARADSRQITTFRDACRRIVTERRRSST